MNALDLVGLPALMERGSGRIEITVALIDGPVLLSHPDFVGATFREIPAKVQGACIRADNLACSHATFVAGILCARRGSGAPAVCPACTILLRPIFSETAERNGRMPSATPEHLAEAIIDTVNAGARILNLSSGLSPASQNAENKLEQALNYAAHSGAITVAAAGNHGMVGSSVITRHAWVIPVAACNMQGRPLDQSNLGKSIGRRGLMAPGQNIMSLGADSKPQISSGTSAATAFVTGAIALLWSEFPDATAEQIKLAITQPTASKRSSITPPLLNAWAAYRAMFSARRTRAMR